MKYIGSAVTDIGTTKEINQDSICVKIGYTKQGEPVAFLLICDGMGGLKKGELASATVIRFFSTWFEEELPMKIGEYSMEELSRDYYQKIREINQKILRYGKKAGVRLGTTMSAILIIKDQYMIGQVGDTRVYRISKKVEQITEDQSFVAREVKRGLMTEEQAKKDPRRNMLLQCIGFSEKVVPDFYFGTVHAGEVFMICSDGLWHNITQKEWMKHLNPKQLINEKVMCEKSKSLIELVKKRNEKDNISIALLKVES